MTNFRLMLVTSRPIIRAVFGVFGQIGHRNLEVKHVSMTPQELSAIYDAPAMTAAVVDAVPDPMAAIEACNELSFRCPDLPFLVLVTCNRSLGSYHLQALIEAGTAGILGPSVTPQEILSAIDQITHGHVVFQLEAGASLSLSEILAIRSKTNGSLSRAEEEAHLLHLVSLGLSDQEISERLRISAPTVRRRIERLRNTTGARNRTELAAWAGMHGFYASGYVS
ncbi:helix-turn-helix transcriptional regulator [Rubrobacter radiotolerans]|uniref:LuxR C-terminal-related transcriptional regulator n=1 Tax=Rubrobacter radiotolerans TaxID=42256 RepID=A0AB35T607_RUBRA|nr:LuxR C-terminal-related transcriptional regulator [Rubrobacter radiotolerans]MDX5895309.1 LuxR C-terminal-related transcriptional regulator [Rubrobacter radiotolerans]SMC01617.1 DNA-binding response regulator, NarL/FixJ family, contains REC and HTH domains [Rubrobacter radiotolerans DSM 5868]